MLAHASLYAILDLGYVRDADAPRLLRQLLEGGVGAVQLRGKNRSADELSALAEILLPLTSNADIPFIVNDHAEIANRVDVQGVHVGQDDASIARVRAQVTRPILVGKSTHSLAQAEAAAAEGADYIGFGPLFATPTKPDYAPIGLADIRTVHEKIAIPIFCIGGIKLENVAAVVAAGAHRVVIVSGLLTAPDVAEYARATNVLLNPRF
ncbi:MAG: thiamine phosphate synthase [Verrucomicrobiota bacterium]|nr:thiamine phosphate synthase [Verrucomicrobiota bacterium]